MYSYRFKKRNVASSAQNAISSQEKIRVFDSIGDVDSELFEDAEIIKTLYTHNFKESAGLWQFSDRSEVGDYQVSNQSSGHFDLLDGDVIYITLPNDNFDQDRVDFLTENQANGSSFEMPLYYSEYNIRRNPASTQSQSFDFVGSTDIAADDFKYHKYLRDKKSGEITEVGLAN